MVDDFRYWTREELKEVGKPMCDGCIFSKDDSCTRLCSVAAKPEEMFWTFGGSIIGCKHGNCKKT